MQFDQINPVVEALERGYCYPFGRPWARCESPIEVLMFAALLYAPWEDEPDRLCSFPVRPRATPLDHFHPTNVFLGPNDEARWQATRNFVAIEPQFPVGDFRCDFAVAGRWNSYGLHVRGCIVECDGAEWHSSTEQTERDSFRQRTIENRLKVRVLRFSGSEIFRDPNGCAARVVEYIRGYVPIPRVEDYD